MTYLIDFELRQAGGGAVLSFVVKVVDNLYIRIRRSNQSNTMARNSTFSRIFEEISGNSMRPVRCSMNKPSGAVKMAATNV